MRNKLPFEDVKLFHLAISVQVVSSLMAALRKARLKKRLRDRNNRVSPTAKNVRNEDRECISASRVL